jgi:hypothetical protein
MVRSPRGIVFGLLVVATAACASKGDVTPMVVVSPGAKERIMVMDRFRHHGSPRRLLPKVTVEEVDEADLPATSDDANVNTNANEETSPASDAGALEP